MKRIIFHWTAGAHKASALDLEHYHEVIEGDGRVVFGKHPISANKAPLSAKYAAHTLNANTDSIGIAVCAMAGAVQAPFKTGKHPITPLQVHHLAKEIARLAKGYNIPVTRQTILSHAEVQPTLGIKQRGKWDIAWIPGWPSATDPIGVGDHIRKLVAEELAGMSRPVEKPTASPRPEPAVRPAPKPTPPVAANPLAGFFAWLSRVFGGKS